MQKELIDMQYTLIWAASEVHKQSAAIEALSGIPLISFSEQTASQLSSFIEN